MSWLKRISIFVWLAPLLGAWFTFGHWHSASAEASPDGAKLFHDYCSVCHGDKGDGRSRARGSMVPPPRDFTTPQAAMELTRERMKSGVRDGRPGTAMAAWATQLSPEEIEAVVDYIRETMMLAVATEDAAEGRRIYAENCSVCHGDDGQGARWTLTNLKPAPRNFTLPHTAEQLSRDYMLQVVSFGKADTAMPGFSTQLSPPQIAAVVTYVRGAFMGVRNEVPVPAKTAPGKRMHGFADMTAPLPQGLDGDAMIGQGLYAANCATCHGLEGDGKGPRAYFIFPKPRNFGHPGARHSLNRPALFLAISKGTLGSEMPAWNKVFTDQEIAHVAEYVFRAFIQDPLPES